MEPVQPIPHVPLICPQCHKPVAFTYYFCPNCGKNLKPAPPSLALADQLTLYIKSALLPPLGVIWGWRYVTQKDRKSKMVGLVAMGITVAVLALVVVELVGLINLVNQQISSQSQNLMGL